MNIAKKFLPALVLVAAGFLLAVVVLRDGDPTDAAPPTSPSSRPATQRETDPLPAPPAIENTAVETPAAFDETTIPGFTQGPTRPVSRPRPTVTPPPFPAAYPSADSAASVRNLSTNTFDNGVSQRTRSGASSISSPAGDGEPASVPSATGASTSVTGAGSVAAVDSISSGAGAAVQAYPPEPTDSIAAAKEALILAHPYDPNLPLVLNPPANAPASEVPDIPVVLAPLAPDYPQLFPEVPVLDALAEAFNDSLVEQGYHPASPDASEVWSENVARSDALFRLYYGDEAYVRMDQQRTQVDSE